jgi:pimeloyl-ACP methyl ester carboxylesterase
MARDVMRSVLTLPGADGAELVAVVHEPEGPPISVTLLLAGGVLPRMGVNRVLVRMADRLAAAGHRAVRVDPGGLGESAGTLPEEPFFDLLRRVESGAFAGDVRLTAEAVAPADRGVPLVLFGTCGGGITALRVAEQLDRVSGVIAVGVPLKRSGARIPPGFARRTERRRALRQLAELRHRTGSGRVRRVIRPLVWSLMPRLSRRLPDDADRWLNTPLLSSMRALYARRLPVSLLYGENDIVRDEIEELFLGLHRLGERPWFELGLIPAVGHQLDDPDEVDAVAERIQRFAEQLRAPSGRAASAASAALRAAGDPAAS